MYNGLPSSLDILGLYQYLEVSFTNIGWWWITSLSTKDKQCFILPWREINAILIYIKTYINIWVVLFILNKVLLNDQ